MSGLDFISHLDGLGVVDPEVLRKLRSKLSRPGKPVSASRVSKFLIEKGELTAPQAERLLQRFRDAQQAEPVELLSEADLVEGGDVFMADELGAGLEDAVPLGAADVVGEGAMGASADEKARRVFEAKKQLANRWESKWMIIGPTLVIVLAMVAAFLWFVLARRSAEKMLEIAESSYRSQSYSEAIDNYQDFLDSYPRHPSASLARVRQGIARIRIFSDSSNWDKALETLPEVLPTIQDEEAFPDEGRPELTSILPRIALGFVGQAERASEVSQKEALVAKTEQANSFVDNAVYLPTSARRQVGTLLTDLAERLATVRRDIDREKRLLSSIEQMDAAIAEDQTGKAFEIRKALIRDFPVLEGDQRLADAALRTAEHEQGLVRPDVPNLKVETEWPATAVQASAVLATRVGGAVPDLEGQIYPLLVRGAVYMVDVSNGQVLWRRPIGAQTSLNPQWVNERGGDLILADQDTQDVMRVEGRTGRLIWRTRIGEPFSTLTLTKDSVWVATRSGRLMQLRLEGDPNAGTQAGGAMDGVVIPQALPVGPASDRTGQYVYQPGLQGNLYVLEPGDEATPMACREVYYLGHRAGAITVPPVLAQGFLFIVENSGNDFSLLHILKPTQRGLGLEPAQAPIRLRGTVNAALELYGRRGLLTLTDLGAINLYEVDLVDEEQPVRPIAEFSRATAPGTYSYYLAEKGRLWVGDDGISAFEVQAQRGRLERISAYEAGDQVVAPFGLYGDTLIEARIRAGSRLISVAAVTADGHEEIWRTDFGAPLAGPPIQEPDGTVLAITSQGDQYVLDPPLLESGVGSVPRKRASLTEQDLVFNHEVDLGQGRVLCFGPREKNRLLGLDPSQTVNSMTLVDSPLPRNTLAFAPVAFGEQVLAGSTEGPVFSLDGFRGTPVGTPFQPAVAPNKVIRWVQSAVLDAEQFVIGDREGNLYRVRREGGGLVKQAETRIDGTWESPLAAVDSGVVGVADLAGVPTLLQVSSDELSVVHETPLPAALTFGPVSVESLALLGTADGRLHAWEAAGSIRWSVPIGETQVVGVTAWGTDRALVSLARGDLAVVDLQSGKIITSLVMGEALNGAPVIHDGRAYVLGADGTVLVVDLPSA